MFSKTGFLGKPTFLHFSQKRPFWQNLLVTNCHWPFRTQISGRNFLPELCGEVHPETAPLQALCCVPLALQNRALFEEVRKGEKVPRKGEEEGWPAKGAKRKKGRVKTGQAKKHKTQHTAARGEGWQRRGLFGPEYGLFKLPKHYVLKGKWPIFTRKIR